MTFLYPLFFIALASIAIPVIIHLFNFRKYKTIYFSNVNFLQTLKQQTQSKNRLKDLLLLVVRCLILASLVTAFAFPIFRNQVNANADIRKHIIIYLDNSYSMQSGGEVANKLEQAKTNARAILKNYAEDDAFLIISSDVSLSNKRWVSKQECEMQIQALEFSPNFKAINEVLAKANEQLKSGELPQIDVYIIGDYQQGFLRDVKANEKLKLYVWPINSPKIGNLSLDSIWYTTPIFQPGLNSESIIRIKNHGVEKAAAGKINVKLDGVSKPPISYNVPANGMQDISWNILISQGTYHNIQLSIDDSSTLFDNELYATFQANADIPVLIIGQGGSTPYLVRALKAESAFKLTINSVTQAEGEDLSKYKFIIVNEVSSISSALVNKLKDFLDEQGNVMVIPNSNPSQTQDFSSYIASLGGNTFGDLTSLAIAQSIAPISGNLPFFNNVFEKPVLNMSMPQISKYYALNRSGNSREQNILKLDNGSPIITAAAHSVGWIYTCAMPFNESFTNFQSNSLFVPLIYRMAFYTNKLEKPYYNIGQDNYISLNPGISAKENVFNLVRDSFKVNPPQRIVKGKLSLFTEGIINQANVYDLQNNAGKLMGKYAFNYDRRESVQKYASIEQVNSWATANKAKVINTTDGKEAGVELKKVKNDDWLWKIAIIAALVLLIIESIIVRWKAKLSTT